MKHYPQVSPTVQRQALARLYSDRRFQAMAWTDSSDYAYICTHLIERSIALLAGELAGTLLDVGCGAQPYRKYFRGVAAYKACDFDASRGNVDFECPADSIPVADSAFDSVLCTEVLEHTPDPRAVWCEFRRIIRPGGKVLLTTPMYWPSHEQPYDFYRYPAHGLIYLAREAGFEVLELLPRGGVWALLGQMTMQCIPQYFRFSAQRRAWNSTLLTIDRYRRNPTVTIGWTLLAKRAK